MDLLIAERLFGGRFEFALGCLPKVFSAYFESVSLNDFLLFFDAAELAFVQKLPDKLTALFEPRMG